MIDHDKEAVATWEAGRPFFPLEAGTVPERALAFMDHDEALCMQLQPHAPFAVVGWTFHTQQQHEAYCGAYPLERSSIS